MHNIVCMFFVPLILFCITCILWRFYNWTLRDTTIQSPLPPGSFGLPFIGETYLFIMLKTKFFDARRKNYGPIYKTHLFGKPTIRITDIRDIKSILVDRGQNITSSWPMSTHALLAGGLALESSDSLHKLKRRMVLRAFTHDALSRFVPLIAEISMTYINKWKMTSQVVYLYPELQALTLHVACVCLLGISPSPEEVTSIMVLFGDFVNGMFSLPVNIPGFAFHKALKARQNLLDIIDRCLQERSRSTEATDSSNIFQDLSSRDNDSEKGDIRNICLELLFAGHETTASAAVTMVINICKDPTVNDEINTELTDTCKSQLTYDIIRQLTYVRSVVKESLRVNPPIGAGYRRVVKSFTCQGYQVPKDWAVICGIRESHENSILTSSPTTFIPERWLLADTETEENFLTFGAGRRKCVGRHFAELFLNVFLVVLVQSCKVRLLTDAVVIDNFPVPHPVDNLPVHVDRK